MPLSHDESCISRSRCWRRCRATAGSGSRTCAPARLPGPPARSAFMGGEIASRRREPRREPRLAPAQRTSAPRFESFVAELGRVYRDTPALWRRATSPTLRLDRRRRRGELRAVLRAPRRRAARRRRHELTPVPHEEYRLGAGRVHLRRVLDSDDARFGGALRHREQARPTRRPPGYPQSLRLRLPLSPSSSTSRRRARAGARADRRTAAPRPPRSTPA